MLLNPNRRLEPTALLEGFVSLLGSETWDDLVVGLLRASRTWLEADEARFWQIDALAGGLRSRWMCGLDGVRDEAPGRIRPFVQPLDEEEDPSPTRLVRHDRGWTLEISCRARGGEIGLLEVRGAGSPPESALVSQWAELAGGALVQGREALRERQQAGGVRRLSGIARELSSCDNPDRFWQRVVEIARDAFGMERCSVLLAGADPALLEGAWGTDFDGRTVPEHGLRLPLAVLESRAGRLLGQVPSWIVLADDLPRCGFGEGATCGSVPLPAVLTPVPGLPEGTCWMLTDSALSGRSVEPAVQDLLESYAALVGQIAGRLRAERALDDFLEDEGPAQPEDSGPPRLAELLGQWEEPRIS